MNIYSDGKNVYFVLMQALVFPSSSHIEHVDSVLMQNVSNPSFSTIKLDLEAPEYERENVSAEIFGTWMRLISTRRRRSPSHGLLLCT